MYQNGVSNKTRRDKDHVAYFVLSYGQVSHLSDLPGAGLGPDQGESGDDAEDHAVGDHAVGDLAVGDHPDY